MTEHPVVNLVELVADLDKAGMQVVFEDEHFRREKTNLKLDSVIETDIIADCLDGPGVKCYHISMYFSEEKSLEFIFAGAEIVSHHQSRLITYAKQQKLFWIPKDPAWRFYDANGRIEGKTDLAFEVTSQPKGAGLRITGKPPGRVEFSLILFSKNIESAGNELFDFSPVELRKVGKSVWFYYETIKDVWDYFINGTVFNSRHQLEKKGWQAQTVAFTLYYYLEFLYNQTAKQIYKQLCEFIAYSVMLSLPLDNRWRHGIWTDIMETHTVHQVSGIHVLLSYYERTGRDVFLQKAKSATDYLISLAENLADEGVWFLHDSLETNMQDARLHYKRLTPSGAFGKSASNTLTLNSHIWTLTALHRMGRFHSSEKYREYSEKGLGSLKKVLQASPCSVLFSCIYWPRDLLIKLSLKTKNKVIRTLLRKYGDRLKQYVLPFLKAKLPRLVMPNGFTERDLCCTSLSNCYHILNVQDMLMLHHQRPQPWLLGTISRSVRYTVDTGLAKHLALSDSRATMFLGVLLMYSCIVDERYLRFLPEYIAYFEKLNLPLPADILSNPLVADACPSLCVNNDNVVILTPVENKNISAVLVNATGKDEKVALKSAVESNMDELEIVDSGNNRFSCRGEVVVPKGGYLKVVRKDGQD